MYILQLNIILVEKTEVINNLTQDLLAKDKSIENFKKMLEQVFF